MRTGPPSGASPPPATGRPRRAWSSPTHQTNHRSADLRQDADGVAAGRPSHAVREAEGTRRLRAGNAAPASSALKEVRAAARPRTPAARRFVAGHRRRSQRLHPVRPLRPRLQRHPRQPGHRPHGQGLQGPHRLRPRTRRWAIPLRGLRRVHGVLSDRGAGQPQLRAARPVAEGEAGARPGVGRGTGAQSAVRGRGPPFLHWNEGAVVRRHFKKGDIICREGDFGSTAFYIEKGKVEHLHQAPIKHVKRQKNRRAGDKVNGGRSA